jgi:hypothetical protein
MLAQMPVLDMSPGPFASHHRARGPIARQEATGSRHFPSRRGAIAAVLLLLAVWAPSTANAQELKFPQIIKIKYEAQDPRVGGHLSFGWNEKKFGMGWVRTSIRPQDPSRSP